jgi:hypothetical protein
VSLCDYWNSIFSLSEEGIATGRILDQTIREISRFILVSEEERPRGNPLGARASKCVSLIDICAVSNAKWPMGGGSALGAPLRFVLIRYSDGLSVVLLWLGET